MSFNHLKSAVEQLKTQAHYRHISPVVGGNKTSILADNTQFINFSSNDYLGMASDPQVIKCSNDAASRYGVGSGGSSLVTGHSKLHDYLQSVICDMTGLEACLLFSSGFAANSATLSTLLQQGDWLIQDKLNHASLMEAGMQSPATMKRFLHNDMAGLERLLNNAKDVNNRLIVTEGVFSMDGDSGALAQIAQLQQAHNAWLMVDDAHGFGLYGEGNGSCYQARIVPNLLMATFGKAIGTGGAFVAANRDTIDYLTNFCRHYMYSTAMPIPVVAATIESLTLVKQPWRRDKLNERINYFKHRAHQLGLDLMPSSSAIQPMVIGGSEQALAVSRYLKSHGLWVNAIRPPTVAPNTARLRITLSSNHQLSQIDTLLEHLERAMQLLTQGHFDE